MNLKPNQTHEQPITTDGSAKTEDGSAKIEKWWSDEVMKPKDWRESDEEAEKWERDVGDGEVGDN